MKKTTLSIFVGLLFGVSNAFAGLPDRPANTVPPTDVEATDANGNKIVICFKTAIAFPAGFNSIPVDPSANMNWRTDEISATVHPFDYNRPSNGQALMVTQHVRVKLRTDISGTAVKSANSSDHHVLAGYVESGNYGTCPTGWIEGVLHEWIY